MLGEDGLKTLASLNFSKSEYLKERLKKIPGLSFPFSGDTYNEFVVEISVDKPSFNSRFINEGIIPGLWLDRFYPQLTKHLLVNVTELHSKEDLDVFVETMKRGIGR